MTEPGSEPAAALEARAGVAVPWARDAARHLRGLVRSSTLWLVLVAILVGAVSGLAVAMLSTASDLMHTLLFGLRGERVSALSVLRQGQAAPIAGGLVLGATTLLWRRRRKSSVPVDPVEANALHGGRMSLTDSLWVSFQTLLSNGCGASVGLEAGYAQIGAGLASKLGSALRLRRNDLRVLVGCGAGAAIGAAFGAPLTGAFYAFELIIGAYTIGNVAPVIAASLAGVLTARAVATESYALVIPVSGAPALHDYLLAMLLGVLCAGVGVAVMRAVHDVERFWDFAKVPRAFRPALGGAGVAGLALITPQVLAAGHGGLRLDLPAQLSIAALLTLIGLKAAASVLSLGSGFRGGLFFASLFLGALCGKLFAAAAALAGPALAVDPTLCILVGMGALAVAVVGGPLTMTFLVLETTGDFAVTAVVLAACIVTSLVVRETFGYSFSTWRLHLRGETIRGGIDVGWMRSLTVGRMMRRDPPTIPGRAGLAELRRRYPLGSTQSVVVVDDDGRYLGMALVVEAFALAEHMPDEAAAKTAPKTAGDIARWADAPLSAPMNIKQAMAVFDATESEALAVVDTPEDRKVIGLLTEGYALRRYAEELDKARQGLAGGV
jgi:CIC family chloride channel protein